MNNFRCALRIATLVVTVVGLGLATHMATSTRVAAQLKPVHYHEHHDLWIFCWCSGDCGAGEDCCPAPGPGAPGEE